MLLLFSGLLLLLLLLLKAFLHRSYRLDNKNKVGNYFAKIKAYVHE